MSERPDIMSHLSERLKAARAERGLSLDAVAGLSGVSRSMVSQIERGESSPTVATLWNLTQALDVDFAGLMDMAPKADTIEVLRAQDVPAIGGLGEGCRIRILSPPDQVGVLEIYELGFDAGGILASAPHGKGAREHLTVLAGQLTVTSGARSKALSVGDSARYAADVDHAIAAEGGPADAILIVQNSG